MKTFEIHPADRRKSVPQGEATKGQLEAELTFKFKFRPAGWAGNDSMCMHALGAVLNMAVSLLTFTGILDGDESYTHEAKWRRPKEGWQKIHIVHNP